MIDTTTWVFNDGHPEKHFRRPMASMFQEGTFGYSLFLKQWSVVGNMASLTAYQGISKDIQYWITVTEECVPKEYRAMLLLLT